MKKQFVIATHGTFAEGLYHSLTIIMGEQIGRASCRERVFVHV